MSNTLVSFGQKGQFHGVLTESIDAFLPVNNIPSLYQRALSKDFDYSGLGFTWGKAGQIGVWRKDGKAYEGSGGGGDK